MNIDLGAPYESAIKRIIEEEELTLVHRAVEIEMAELNAGKIKNHSFQDIKNIVASGI